MALPGHQRRRPRRRLLALAALTVAAVPLTVAAALAATSRPVVIGDAGGDVSGPLDLQRVTLHRSSDGRLRAIVTFVGTVSPQTLLASSGPPGSVCLRVWTAPGADPTSMRPNRLVCATARSEDELRGGIFEQRSAGLPRRVGSVMVRTNRSGRSFVFRITQSSLGRPASFRFAAESTRPGCERATCIDAAPAGGRARMFRLR
jgi:hypothetical protein